MSRTRLILVLFVLPALILAGCSPVSLSVSQAPHMLDTISHQVQTVLPVSVSLADQTGPLAAYEGTLEQIYQDVNPSVVNIQVVQSGGEALGSGFVWDADGHIVTNNHVVEGGGTLSVTFADGTTLPAKVVGADPNSDLAVIQVQASSGQLKPVTLADSNQVKVGQLAIAIGNPFGLQGTMTEGIISGLGRALPVDHAGFRLSGYTIPDIIQTDASINPGNSGGVLVDAQGQVIGVTSAIESPVQANAGIGFVIPASIVQKIVPELIKSGHYNHTWLGISGTALSADVAAKMNLQPEQKGVLVVDVVPNSPAQKAGLHGSTQNVTLNGQRERIGGDVITAIDGQTVNTFGDVLSYLLNNTQVGQEVSLTLLSHGQQNTVSVVLAALPK